MRRLVVVVEGQTERQFVNELLAPAVHAASGGEVWPEAVLIGTPGQKGGRVSLTRIASDTKRLIDHRDAVVTTLVDFYGRQKPWPLSDALPQNASSDERQAAAEEDILEALRAAGVGSSTLQRFHPYVQMHEWEALLFSDLEATEEALAVLGLARKLRDERGWRDTPEDVNDGKQTAPSKRIIGIDPSYENTKVVRGNAAAAAIGLPKMRAACPRFDAWVRWLETSLDG